MTACALESTGAYTGAQFSTYRIGGPIDEAYQPASFDEAVSVLDRVKASGGPFTVIGWGSNLIIASAGIRGITLITRKMNWVREADGQTGVFGAGVHLAKAAKWAEERSLSGGEFMIGIPGTVGGAVRMNAGALGQETSEVVKSVTLYNLETGALKSSSIETWGPDRLHYSYRHSAIDPRKHAVLEAELTFRPGNHDDIVRLMEGSVSFRKKHHPTEPNGGSVFKNPYPKASDKGKMTAGWMLDQLGAKAWAEGGVRVSPLHANFIVNTGHGTSTDLLRLMLRMKRAIRAEYGVDVTPENLLIGDATPEELELWHELTGGAGIGAH